MPPVANPSFETAGASQGDAASWTVAVTSSRDRVALFEAALPRAAEDFERGWRDPIGEPVSVTFGNFNTATDTYTDSGTSFSAGTPRLQARVTTALTGGPVTLTVTYTNELGAAGRVGTVTLGANAPVGTIENVVLQGSDQGAHDVSACVEAAPFAGPGVVELRGVRGLEWEEGSTMRRESALGGSNETGLFVYDVALHLTSAVFATGQSIETFDTGWNNDAGRLDDLAALATQAASFDAAPALSSGTETLEDFEEGWAGSSRTSTPVALGTYRISDNAFTDGVVGTNAVGPPLAYPLLAGPRARVTEALGPTQVDLGVTFIRWAGDAPARTATVRLAASSPVDAEHAVVHADFGAGTAAVHDVQGIASETPDVAVLGLVALEADQLPAEAQMTRGAAIVSLQARRTVGTGDGAVQYEARALGQAGVAVRVFQRVQAPSAASTTVSVAGSDVTVNLRSDAASAILATAVEVALAVGSTPGAAALVVVSALGAGTGTAGTNGALEALQTAVAGLDVAAALFDAGVQNVEDFEGGWDGNEGDVFSYAVVLSAGPPAAQQAFARLTHAAFGGATVHFGSYNAATGVFTNDAAAPGPTYPTWALLRVDVLFVGAVGDTLDLTYLDQGGAASSPLRSSNLAAVTHAGTTIAVGPLAGDTEIRDVTAAVDSGYTAGVVDIQGAIDVVERFESGWTEVL